MPEIIFEDNHLIAVNKKPGEIVQVDKTGDESLEESIKKYLKKKFSKPGEVFLGVVHRLDRPVSGVVLFARTSKALERLNKMFREKTIQKTYWAVVKKKPREVHGKLTHFLKRNTEKNTSSVFEKEVPDSKKAELEYKLLAADKEYYFLEVTPFTGRHHQIRVQLASMGCPIKGDVKYGYADLNEDGSIHLHARKIEFMHPVTKNVVVIKAEPPVNSRLWNVFREG